MQILRTMGRLRIISGYNHHSTVAGIREAGVIEAPDCPLESTTVRLGVRLIHLELALWNSR